jgi:hypothetical protein
VTSHPGLHGQDTGLENVLCEVHAKVEVFIVEISFCVGVHAEVEERVEHRAYSTTYQNQMAAFR